MPKFTFIENYRFSFLLLGGIAVGCLLGLILKTDAVVLKPLGDIFLNLLFAVVVPLVFFAVSSAVASIENTQRLGKIIGWMLAVFIITSIFSSVLMLFAVKAFPPAEGVSIAVQQQPPIEEVQWSEKLVKTFTVSDFGELFSKKNMLAIILFSFLVGLSCLVTGAKAAPFRDFLIAGNTVFTRVVGFILLYAPIGLGAYFAYLVGSFGPQLLGSYVRSVAIYYPVAIFYFVVFFSLYAYWSAGWWGIKSFWQAVIPVSITAWGTGSSLASMPVSLEAAKNLKIPKSVREIIIPIGAAMHSDGSCLSAVLKIAFLFGVYNMDFHGPETMLTAIGIALLSGTVMSGIPGGGFLGELMIVTMYGFPLEALPMISMIGTLVDPPATMVNAVGDNVTGMMVSRITMGKRWMEKSND